MILYKMTNQLQLARYLRIVTMMLGIITFRSAYAQYELVGQVGAGPAVDGWQPEEAFRTLLFGQGFLKYDLHIVGLDIYYTDFLEDKTVMLGGVVGYDWQGVTIKAFGHGAYSPTGTATLGFGSSVECNLVPMDEFSVPVGVRVNVIGGPSDRFLILNGFLSLAISPRFLRDL